MLYAFQRGIIKPIILCLESALVIRWVNIVLHVCMIMALCVQIKSDYKVVSSSAARCICMHTDQHGSDERAVVAWPVMVMFQRNQRQTTTKPYLIRSNCQFQDFDPHHLYHILNGYPKSERSQATDPSILPPTIHAYGLPQQRSRSPRRVES